MPIKTSQVVVLGAVGLIAYSLFRKSAGLGSLVFFPDKVKSLKFEGTTPIMVIGLGVQNTSNQSFTINSMAGNAYSNGYYVGNLSSFVPQTIAPNSQAIVNINIRLQLIGMANDLIDAFRNGNYQQDLNLQLMANVDTLQVPINLNFKVG